MIHNVFSIYDSKAAAYLPPFILPRIEMGQRVFSDAINSKDHQFGKHPEDYTLFHLGTFDDERAYFEALGTPNSLGIGVEYVQTKDVTATEGPSNGEITPTALGNGAPIQPGPAGDDTEI
jgi:hypothetical protein